MAIGTSKIGVLGGGVAAGSQTFNAPGNYTPVGVSVVSIVGKGGAGNAGNSGNAGVNPGTGGGGGAGGGTKPPTGWRTTGGVGGNVPGGGNGGPAPYGSPSSPGNAGNSGTGGNAGSAGSAGTASTAISLTFAGAKAFAINTLGSNEYSITSIFSLFNSRTIE